MDNRAIGVFDSGLGGLTVLREMIKKCPNENLVYFGDCGRIPYGTKSKDTVQKYTIQDINFLLSKNVKAIVIACNTASAYGFEMARQRFDIPVFEVVTPGARAAVRVTKTGRIGVIGTPGTISTGVYEKAIRQVASESVGAEGAAKSASEGGAEGGAETKTERPRKLEIISKACPMFVPLVEEGWWDNEIAFKIVEEYLLPLKEQNIDTLVLGCTHYPILEATISKVLGEGVQLVSSGVEMAKDISDFVCLKEIHSDSQLGICEYYTSDSIEKFIEMGQSFLGQPIPQTEHISIEKY